MSLEELVCTLVPVRSTLPPSSRIATGEGSADNTIATDALASGRNKASTAAEELSVPKELWRLVDTLWRQGMREPDLFIAAGSDSEVP